MSIFTTKRALITAISVCFLSGCMVGPDFLKPKTDAPATFRGADAITSSSSIADTHWWELFNDPALVDLINEGLKNNFDLKIAAARVEQYRAIAGVKQGALFPQIEAGVNYNAQNGSELSSPRLGASDYTSRNWDAGAQISWEVDLFGRLRREDEAAVARWMATEEAKRGVTIALVADIADAYFTLLQFDAQLKISQQTLASDTRQVQFYRDRLGGGVSNMLEVNQAEANRANTAARVPEFERLVAIQENRLNLLLGRAPNTIKRGKPLDAQYVPPTLPVGLPIALISRRPDILESEQNLAAANADVGAAKALFFPSINLVGASGSLSHEFNDLGRSDSTIWSVNNSLLQPLFKGGAILSNYEAAKARFDEAMAQYQKTVQNSFRETSDAIVSEQKSRIATKEYLKAATALRSSTELSRDRYLGGLASYLEVLTADQDYFTAQLQLAETRRVQLAAMVNLYRALGGGWSTEKTKGENNIVAK